MTLEEAERQIIAAFKQLYGQLAEPGVVWVREQAIRMLKEQEK